MAAAALAVSAACSGGEPGDATSPSVASSTAPSVARPLDERADAQQALRTTDLSIEASNAEGLEVRVSNHGPNPAIAVVVDVHVRRGIDLETDDSRCARSGASFRCTDSELPARQDLTFVFRGSRAAGSASVAHDGPELDPADNSVDFA